MGRTAVHASFNTCTTAFREVILLIRRLVCLLCILCLLIPCALADDVCLLDPSIDARVETDRNYIRLSLPIGGSGAAGVSVRICDPDGQTVYQRNYPDCEGSFRSEDIFLRLEGAETDYTVTVDMQGSENTSYVSHVIRRLSRLENNTACSAGLSLKTVTGKKSWLSVTVLDLEQLRNQDETVAIHASNAYSLGSVTFSLSNGELSASLTLPDDCTLHSSTMDVALTAVDAQSLGTKTFHGLRTTVNHPVNVGDADYVCILLQLRVSYSPAGLPGSPAMNTNEQKTLWENMQQDTRHDSNG